MRTTNCPLKKHDETQILEDTKPGKSKLLDVGLRYTRCQANDLADGWRQLGTRNVRVYHKYIHVDGISYPVFMVVAREKKP